MVGDTGDDVDEDLIGIDENVITMDKSGDSDCWQQQKWDTFVKERSRGYGSVAGLSEQVVVAFAAG